MGAMLKICERFSVASRMKDSMVSFPWLSLKPSERLCLTIEHLVQHMYFVHSCEFYLPLDVGGTTQLCLYQLGMVKTNPTMNFFLGTRSQSWLVRFLLNISSNAVENTW